MLFKVFHTLTIRFYWRDVRILSLTYINMYCSKLKTHISICIIFSYKDIKVWCVLFVYCSVFQSFFQIFKLFNKNDPSDLIKFLIFHNKMQVYTIRIQPIEFIMMFNLNMNFWHDYGMYRNEVPLTNSKIT